MNVNEKVSNMILKFLTHLFCQKIPQLQTVSMLGALLSKVRLKI